MTETPRFPDDGSRRRAVALSFVPGVGCAAFRECVATHGSAAAAFEEQVMAAHRPQALAQADSAIASADRLGAMLLVLGEAAYPESLLDLPDPPSVLYALGVASLVEAPMVGIVGTRQASPGGERTAHRLAGALVRAGAGVVSGMARGIDAAAHRGAMDAGGLTIAVLGGGVDNVYPTGHRTLYGAIAAQGALLSEAAPGTRPIKGAFPRRNRIIAALGRAVIVVEAGERSGALITADRATEIGRPLGAVPGSIDAPQCAGSNLLLRDGATLVTCEADVLGLAGLVEKHREDRPESPRRTRTRERTTLTTLASSSLASDPQEAAVLAAVRSGASDVAALTLHTNLDARHLTSALASLELAGVLWTDHAGGIRLTR